jgi:hypothetical protein
VLQVFTKDNMSTYILKHPSGILLAEDTAVFRDGLWIRANDCKSASQ